MNIVKTYVEFHFENGSVSKQIVKNRKLSKLEIPTGVVKFRFFDTQISAPIGIAAFNFVPKESEPFNFSNFFMVT